MSGEVERSLVMPFVVCDDGTYDTASFVAGWECASIDAWLAGVHQAGAVTLTRYVNPSCVPQLDLIAMRHGFTLETEPWDEHPDEWALATFATAGAVDEPPVD